MTDEPYEDHPAEEVEGADSSEIQRPPSLKELYAELILIDEETA